MRVNLFGAYPKYKKNIRAALEEMTDEYPVLHKLIKVVRLKWMNEGFKKCLCSCRSIWGWKLQYEIKLNPKVFMFPGITAKFISVRPGAYYYSVKDLIYHEVGHCLQYCMPCKQFGLDMNEYKWSDYRKYIDVLESNQTEECYKEYFERFFTQFKWGTRETSAYLGTYAATHVMELLPECFNNYYHLRSKQPIFGSGEKEAYEFAKAVIEDYKKYIPEQ